MDDAPATTTDATAVPAARSADRPAAQNFTVALTSPQPGAKVALVGKDTIELTGQIEPRANPASSWTGSTSAPTAST